jgi:hypothetical protein
MAETSFVTLAPGMLIFLFLIFNWPCVNILKSFFFITCKEIK